MNNSIVEILRKLRIGDLVSENELLKRMSSGDTIFQYAIKKGRIINCDKFKETRSLDIILENKKYDLLRKVSLKTLLKPNRKNPNKRYIETILESFKNDNSINISFISPFDEAESFDDIADFYLIYLKYGLVDYLPYLTSEYLLLTDLEKGKKTIKSKIKDFFFSQEDKTFLEVLLSKADEKTIDKLLIKSLKRKFDIAMILRTHSLNQEKVDYELKPNTFIDDVVKEINKQYDSIVLSHEENALLRKLYDLFISNSDKVAVEALINSYKIQLKKKNPNTIKEILELIRLKEDGKIAFIKLGDSCYSLESNGVEIKNGIIDTLNHEMGHALFHNCTDGEPPEEFWSIIDRIRNDASTIRKVNEYSKSQTEETKKVNDLANEYYDKSFPLMNKVIEVYKIRNQLKSCYNYDLDRKRIRLERETEDIRREISEYLSLSKEEKMKAYLEKGYSREELEVLFSNTFTVKEYARMHKRIQKREFCDAINSSFMASSRSIGDILDAIYQGNFLAGNLYYQGNKINPVSGHGLFYYNYNKERVFDEILADFRTIMMGEYSEKYLSELRYYVGDELVDFLDNYYNNIMIQEKGVKYGRR